MIETVALKDVFFDTEPDIPAVGGPMCKGYEEYLSGHADTCCQIIGDFLASVYASRPGEMLTHFFVLAIYTNRGLQAPARRENVDARILVDAAQMRFDHYHKPLIQSIMKSGYLPYIGDPVTMYRNNGTYLVSDGKNRSSILAAMGREYIEHVRVME